MISIKKVLISLFGIVLLSGLDATINQNARAADYSKTGYYSETITTGLGLPTAIEFTPDGRTFVAQKGGEVRVVDAAGNLLTQPLYTLSNVNDAGDRGLLGIAVDPDFTTNGFVYLAHTHENNSADYSGKKTARVTRITTNGNGTVAGSEVVLLGSVGGNASTPSCHDYQITDDCIPSDSLSHTIGGLRFGADGKLYVSIGDGAGFTSADPKAFLSQDTTSLAGKLLRLNTDGTAPSDNPFFTGNANDNASKVWAYGFRNPYRFNLRPGTNEVILADVGWFTREEVNIVTKGGNYGWPCREGTVATVGGYNNLAGCPIAATTIDPIHDYAHENGVGAITGGAFATNAEYPAELRDNYIFADFTLDFMRILDIANGSVVAQTDIATNVAGPVEFKTDSQGYVQYLSIYTGELRRIRYQDNSQPQDPIAVIEATGFGGAAPYSVVFDATDSYDPNGEPITSYNWNFGDGTSSIQPNPSHTYTATGTYTVALTVTNNIGESASASRPVVVVPAQNVGADIVYTGTLKTPETNYIGSSVDLTTTFQNVGTSDNVSLYLFVMNESYETVGALSLAGVAFEAGETRQFNFNWLPPGVGVYYYYVGAYSADWTQEILPVQHALDVNIVNRNPGGDPDPAIEYTNITAPATVTEGDTALVTASFTNTGGSGTVLINIEVHDATGQKVAQSFFENVLFSADETQEFALDWPTSLTPGTYAIHASVFSTDWQELLQWTNAAATVDVLDDSNPINESEPVIVDGLTGANWNDNGSWGSTTSSVTSTRPDGQQGQVYKIDYTQAWAGVYLHMQSGTAANPDDLLDVRLFIKKDQNNNDSAVNLDIYNEAGERIASVALEDYIVDGGSLDDDGWHEIVIPAGSLNLTQRIGAIVLQDTTGQPSSYTVSDLEIRSEGVNQ